MTYVLASGTEMERCNVRSGVHHEVDTDGNNDNDGKASLPQIQT